MSSALSSNYFRQAVKAKIAGTALGRSAGEVARSAGFSEAVIEIAKGAIGGLVSTSGAGSIMVSPGDGSKHWFNTLQAASVFARLLALGLPTVPALRSYGIVTTPPTAYIVAEGKAAPPTLFGASATQLQPISAVALMALTNEVATATDPGSIEAFDAEMRTAVSAAVDAKFWQLIGGGVTGFSLGTSAGSFKADTQELLAAVNTAGTGPLVWALSPDVANLASAYDERMSPIGGEILRLPAIVSGILAPGTLRLVNAMGLVGNLAGVEIDSSARASLEMAAPTTDPAGSHLVSMWQSGMIAVRAQVAFSVARVRSNAAHEITSIAWTS